MHAIEVQKEIISLMGEIDDTGPLSAKEGRILVLLNALGAEISYDPKERNGGFEKQGIAKFWMRHAIRQLPGCIALMGNYGGEFDGVERWIQAVVKVHPIPDGVETTKKKRSKEEKEETE
jgi:hypothetical protein